MTIVDQAIWNSAWQRQTDCALASSGDVIQAQLNGTHRRKFVLSRLLECAACSADYKVVAKDRYGCAMYVKATTCSNGSTISRAALERRVLDALQDKIMASDAITEFIVAYNGEVAVVPAAGAWEQTTRTAELVKIDRKNWRDHRNH